MEQPLGGLLSFRDDKPLSGGRSFEELIQFTCPYGGDQGVYDAL